MAAKIVPAPDYEERVRASFMRQQAMATIGAELTLVTPGIIEIEMPYSATLTQHTTECPNCEHLQTWTFDDVERSSIPPK